MPETEQRRISGLQITIERGTCIGSDNCTQVAPEVFVLAYDAIVTFVDDVEDIDRDRLIEACAVCPVDALIVEDEDGRQIVP